MISEVAHSSSRVTPIQILAFERDRHRFATLESMVAKAGCKNIEAFNTDFLSVDPQDSQFAAVTHM